MTTQPDNAPIIRYLRRCANELVQPIERVQRLYWQAGDETLNGLWPIYSDLHYIAMHFGASDYQVSENEALLLRNIREFLGYEDPALADYWSNPDYRRGYCNIYRDNYLESPDVYESARVPKSVQILESYDALYGTDFADKARTLNFRFALAFVKADGEITAEEEAALREFKEVLFSSPRLDEQATAQNYETVNKEEEPRTLDELLSELNTLVGLDAVKNDVLQLVNFLKVQQLRKTKGMTTVPISRHLVFYGNPGTGKTTVARLLSKIYKSLNILSKGHQIETDRSGLVAGYMGQTALKVKEVADKALGGILFIDEAYSLTAEGDDYGREAIDTLIKLMEDNRGDLIVVVAGYTDKMNTFLVSNPGLRSRFNKYFSFEDYTPLQLVNIFELFCNHGGFRLSKGAREKLLAIFHVLHGVRDETFGNARLARNVFERAINNQANRIISLTDINEEVLSTIETVDIPGEVELRSMEGVV